ncbi:translation initiation factor IF-3 [Roseibium sp. SCPC15]|uniref:translation initiation factor IF-3 n=1 Tax=Roseibium sp. SCP15 TaxID=3141376 RepID=UPI00333D1153
MDGGKFLVQLLKIVCGFIFALIASSLFLAWGFFQAAHPSEDPVAFATMVGTGLVGASVVGAAALVPAAVLITVAELVRLRGVIFHVAAGGGVAFLLWTLGGPAQVEGVRPGSSVALAAGFLAGFVYWLVAGRTSGAWLGNSKPDLSGAD